MKNQSLRINLNALADALHDREKKLAEQGRAVMALARELTRDYPNLEESEGMEYVERDIIELGRQKKADWAEIVEKVMIENLRLKSSVTALGEEYNQKLRSK
jgi:hypothetical protein